MNYTVVIAASIATGGHAAINRYYLLAFTAAASTLLGDTTLTRVREN